MTPVTERLRRGATLTSGALLLSLTAPHAAGAPLDGKSETGFQRRLDELRDAGVIGIEGRGIPPATERRPNRYQ
ncbi:hypothetical protein AGRA3207_004858 [Actinomadura graeca]|uniref:Uncharacterized protein n=1 Tax=Actinomadura graeca TaxID=2750812 RepID=A0ABX8QYB3_9ACTN|nr:hypothetical protein [Actinomadura graeca]QXJ23668.1 hypothetical protein AGRA3207_004858 [Actinomadura graeca]